jgi:ATP-dependent Clp protease protease subunit
MQMKYRSQRNAEAAAKYWNKPLERPDWYKINALSDSEAEIMIYDAIGWPFNDAGDFVRALNDMKQSQITVRINSPGGDVFDAMAIYNALQAHGSKIVTRIEAMAASAASYVALAGKEVQAYKNAMMMIHEPWIMAFGNQYDLRDAADILDKISGNMVDIYAGNSNMGKREVKDMMKAETWMTAKEAKDKGFVDTVLDAKSAKAQFDLSIFANAPAELTVKSEKELTERDAERILREAGFSRNKAKAMLAGRLPAKDQEMDEISAKIKQLTESMKG